MKETKIRIEGGVSKFWHKRVTELSGLQKAQIQCLYMNIMSAYICMHKFRRNTILKSKSRY